MDNSCDRLKLSEEIIDNKSPIDPFTESERSKYEYLLNNFQGGIIKNYEQPYYLHFFISFQKEKINETKQWIQNKIAKKITSTYKQFQSKKNQKTSRELRLNFFLSSNGYKALGFNNIELRLTDAHFNQGMRKWYQSNIADLPPKNWDLGDSDNIHALISLAHNDLDRLEQEAIQVTREIESLGIGNVISCEAGYVFKNQSKSDNSEKHSYVVGPFGFADNLSQPLFLKSDLDKYYETQQITQQDQLKWDPFAPLKLVLVEDPFQPGQYGSYCVWQKLETDYQCFRDKEQELANKLGVDRERAGALIIGRFRDGTPLELSLERQGNEQNENNFDYQDDPNGLRCPLHAHIRKVNPRGDRDPNNPNSPPPISSQKRSRIFRAGMTYFDDRKLQPGSEPKNPRSSSSQLAYLREVSQQSLAAKIKAIGGLLFVCFQSSIVRQFSTLQISWANDPAFPRQQRGHNKYLDPMSSDAPEKPIVPQQWPQKWNQKKKEDFLFQGCVQNKGGEFFFAPSIGFLQNIVNLTN